MFRKIISDLDTTKYDTNYQIAKSKLMNVSGSLSVYNDDNLRYLQSVKKDLSIYSNYKHSLKLNNLLFVGGNIHIREIKQVEMNNLRTVGGNLYVGDDAKVSAHNLKSVSGDLHIAGPVKFDGLQCIGGCLSISWGTKLNSLIVIGNGLSIYAGYKLETLNLRFLSGELHIDSGSSDLNNAILNRKIITWRNADSSYLTTKLPAKKLYNSSGKPFWVITKNHKHEQPEEQQYESPLY